MSNPKIKALEKLVDTVDKLELLVDGSLAILSCYEEPQLRGGYLVVHFPYRPERLRVLEDRGEEMLALYHAYMKAVISCDPWTDVLAPIHGNVVGDAKGRGQFFTPENFVDGAMRFLDQPSDRIEQICDPTCGAGSFLLGAFRAGRDPYTSHVVAMDLDPLCCSMTALQFVANAHCHIKPVAQLDIHHGDVISQYNENTLYWSSISNVQMRVGARAFRCTRMIVGASEVV